MSKKIILVVWMISILLIPTTSTTLVELFGMSHLLYDLGRVDPVVHANGESSVAYTLDPSIFDFLKNFKSRT